MSHDIAGIAKIARLSATSLADDDMQKYLCGWLARAKFILQDFSTTVLFTLLYSSTRVMSIERGMPIEYP